MVTYSFKTNINCSGCVAIVTPYLQQIPQVQSWQIDTQSPEKILTVTLSGQATTAEAVIEKIKAAGYQITPLNP